jgi:hypothetical protein
MERNRLASVWQRIYADFFMPSKLDAYKVFLREFIDRGYTVCSAAYFWERVKKRQLDGTGKYLLLRHDIDTDVATAKAMWQIEQSIGVKSSYYFRLATVDFPLMREIELSGGEASYHYEEIATVAKQKRLKTREQVFRDIAHIRDLFRRNLNRLREQSGISMRIVASHGDFVNRKLRVYNWEILRDESFRKEMGIDLEVYDQEFVSYFDSRHSEVSPPHIWKPEDPLKSAESGHRIMHVLVHPRNWQANPKENLIDDIKRLWEGICYSF